MPVETPPETIVQTSENPALQTTETTTVSKSDEKTDENKMRNHTPLTNCCLLERKERSKKPTQQ